MSTAMERTPITTPRSKWRPIELGTAWADAGVTGHVRNVSDGTLRTLVGVEPEGWHLSVSFVDHKGRPSRYPRWDEIADARDVLLPADVGFFMHFPTSGEYVALHDTTFHLHEHPPRTA